MGRLDLGLMRLMTQRLGSPRPQGGFLFPPLSSLNNYAHQERQGSGHAKVTKWPRTSAVARPSRVGGQPQQRWDTEVHSTRWENGSRDGKGWGM
jgi:hypothetical protein